MAAPRSRAESHRSVHKFLHSALVHQARYPTFFLHYFPATKTQSEKAYPYSRLQTASPASVVLKNFRHPADKLRGVCCDLKLARFQPSCELSWLIIICSKRSLVIAVLQKAAESQPLPDPQPRKMGRLKATFGELSGIASQDLSPSCSLKSELDNMLRPGFCTCR